MKKNKFYFLPKTRIGKIAAWLGISGLITIILLNVLAEMIYCGICPEGYRKDGNACNPECYYNEPRCLAPSVEPTCNMDLVESTLWRIFDVIIGLLAIACVIIGGISSIVAIIKYRDHSILLFLPFIIGIIGLFFVLGEIFIPH